MHYELNEATQNSIQTPKQRPVDLYHTIGEMNGKVDMILFRLDLQDKERRHLEDKVDGIDNRVKRVENRHTWIAGSVAAIGGLLIFFKARVTGFLDSF